MEDLKATYSKTMDYISKINEIDDKYTKLMDDAINSYDRELNIELDKLEGSYSEEELQEIRAMEVKLFNVRTVKEIRKNALNELLYLLIFGVFMLILYKVTPASEVINYMFCILTWVSVIGLGIIAFSSIHYDVKLYKELSSIIDVEEHCANRSKSRCENG